MIDTKRPDLRHAFGAFATGVTVVTTRQSDGTPRGFTANSFTSVSLDPAMLLICIGKTAHSCEVFKTANHFTVNILSDAQKEVSGLFASRQPDKFDQTDWYAGHADMPLLAGSLATFVCKRHKVVDAGDHIVLIGEVEDFDQTDRAPLGYYRGSYFSISAEDTLVAAAARSANLRIGAILRAGQDILLTAAKDGAFSLPYAPEGTNSHQGLLQALKERGLQTDPLTLYAVYDEAADGTVGVYYQGNFTATHNCTGKKFPISNLPFDQIKKPAERSMLRRYAQEYKHGSFGIYQGNQDTGTVHHLVPAKNS